MYYDFYSIDKIVEKHSERFVALGQEYRVKVINLHKKAYWDEFQNILNRKSFWIGEPDTFKVAACLVAALIKQKVLRFDVSEATPNEVLLCNYQLAVDVALDFLSTTKIYTYTADSSGNFTVEQTHPKVELEFPAGIIEAEEIYSSLCKSLAYGDCIDNTVCVTGLSITLHLLYCYCSKK